MENLPNEEWLPVPGFWNYDVSSFGRCRKTTRTGFKEIKGKLDRIGYRQFGLLKPDRKQEWFLAHRLIASVFLELPSVPKGKFLTVNHKNRVRHDNRVSNLELVTVQDNHRHWRKLSLEELSSRKEGVVHFKDTDGSPV